MSEPTCTYDDYSILGHVDLDGSERPSPDIIDYEGVIAREGVVARE